MYSLEDEQCIGTIELVFDSSTSCSSHIRKIKRDLNGNGFGAEALSGVLEQIVKPSIGKIVLDVELVCSRGFYEDHRS